MERDGQDFGAAAASLIGWWSDAGVDVALDEAPRNWLKPAAKAAPAVLPASAPVAPVPSEDGPPPQLNLFQAWLASSDTLPFAAPSAARVCPAGDPTAGLMIVTDMPTGEDCNAGVLISGEAGGLFDRMLTAIGRDRASIYLAALSCLRSPDGRLNSQGAKQCAALARHHAGLVMPKALLILGDAASKALLGLPLVQARGRWHQLDTHAGPVKALVTLPPGFLLAQPAAKAHAWADLQLLMQEVNA
jgi:uracil-DNA glycosylase family 4